MVPWRISSFFFSNVDVCDANPCLNGGLCNQKSSTSYSCICKQGFSGINCGIGKYIHTLCSSYNIQMNLTAHCVILYVLFDITSDFEQKIFCILSWVLPYFNACIKNINCNIWKIEVNILIMILKVCEWFWIESFPLFSQPLSLKFQYVSMFYE